MLYIAGVKNIYAAIFYENYQTPSKYQLNQMTKFANWGSKRKKTDEYANKNENETKKFKDK